MTTTIKADENRMLETLLGVLTHDQPQLVEAEDGAASECGLVRVLPIGQIHPSPENDKLYKPIDPHDPALQALAQSIAVFGVKEPLILTQDKFIVSGHRRYAAACLAGLREVPCRIESITRDSDQFMTLLRECNRQREKTDAEKLREVIVSANPDEAYEALMEHREKTATVDLPPICLQGEKIRSDISDAKMPFLLAAIDVINALRKFWPLSLRQIHYRLLNNPPLIHAKKPDSIYQNKQACYKSLSDLLTRARIAGYVNMNIIQDETRPMATWDVHQTPTPFIDREIGDFLKGYRRDLQQSQPNHIEVCLEKNTVKGVLEQVAGRYSIPVTTMRGFTSIPPRHAVAERFKHSGKEKLILLVLSDFDPDGEEIAHSLARSMRDDFRIEGIHPIKVGLTFAQVKALQLPPDMEAKSSSANFKKFAAKYGTNAYELEAVAPEQLQRWLREAIEGVMDIDAFNAELDQEKEDAVQMEQLRSRVHQELQEWLQEDAD